MGLVAQLGDSSQGLPFADRWPSSTALTSPLPFAPYSAPSANDLSPGSLLRFYSFFKFSLFGCTGSYLWHAGCLAVAWNSY